MSKTNIIEKLRDLDRLATAAPWEFFDYVEDEHPLCIVDKNRNPIIDGTGWSMYEGDAELIATMRNALTLFLELVEAAEETHSQYVKICEGGPIIPAKDIGRLSKALAKLKEPSDEV